MPQHPKPLQEFAAVVLGFLRETSRDPQLDEFVRIARQPMTNTQAAMLVSDVLEWAQVLDGENLAELDLRLSRHDLPTLSLMRSREDRQLARILARGKIKTETEWRLVNARVSDVDGPLTGQDRRLAGMIMVKYEQERTV